MGQQTIAIVNLGRHRDSNGPKEIKVIKEIRILKKRTCVEITIRKRIRWDISKKKILACFRGTFWTLQTIIISKLGKVI